jgi:EmrB/QacA subfamily drug resistance transporter
MPLLVLLCAAQLMVILDISAVNVALPSLSTDLGIGRGDVEWTITSYSLLFGSLLLLGGRAADLLGRRRVFLAGLALFTGASAAAALAPTAAALYAARAGQGIGAALLSPAALSIVTTAFTGAARARALAVWGAVAGAGAAIGVLLGGVLTDVIDWRAIFFVNLPIGAVVAVGVKRAIRRDPAPPRFAGLDLRGALVAIASLGALLYALGGASDAGWGSARTLGFGGAGLAGLALFVALERRTARPLVRLGALADRAVGGGAALMLLASAVLFGAFLLTSIYLQEVLRATPLEAGLEFLPIAVATALGAHGAGHLVRRHGVRATMALAFALAATGMALMSTVAPSGSYVADVLPWMLVAGAGLGMAMVSVAIAVLTGAGEQDAGMLSGLNTTGHEVGGAFGVAVLTTAVAGTQGALVDGLGDAFLVAAGIAGAGLVLALLVLPAAGRFLPRLREAPQAVTMH